MKNEDWKEWIADKDLDTKLMWLLYSYDAYLREAQDKWNSLRHASLITDNYKESVDYNNREADAQRERYEWLLNDISENYVNKTKGGNDESTKV